MLCISGLVYFISPINERLKEALNYKGEYPIEKQWGGRALRELKWSCAVELIKKNFWTGVGTGDVQDELDECYKLHNYVPLLYWKDTRYNAHNQYLETFVELGIAGILILICCFGFALIVSMLRKNFLYFILILLFAISCLTESFLERQHGIVFYALFNSLFAFHNFSKE
jgi:O-antigen ligase